MILSVSMPLIRNWSIRLRHPWDIYHYEYISLHRRKPIQLDRSKSCKHWLHQRRRIVNHSYPNLSNHILTTQRWNTDYWIGTKPDTTITFPQPARSHFRRADSAWCFFTVQSPIRGGNAGGCVRRWLDPLEYCYAELKVIDLSALDAYQSSMYGASKGSKMDGSEEQICVLSLKQGIQSNSWKRSTVVYMDYHVPPFSLEIRLSPSDRRTASNRTDDVYGQILVRNWNRLLQCNAISSSEGWPRVRMLSLLTKR